MTHSILSHLRIPSMPRSPLRARGWICIFQDSHPSPIHACVHSLQPLSSRLLCQQSAASLILSISTVATMIWTSTTVTLRPLTWIPIKSQTIANMMSRSPWKASSTLRISALPRQSVSLLVDHLHSGTTSALDQDHQERLIVSFLTGLLMCSRERDLCYPPLPKNCLRMRGGVVDNPMLMTLLDPRQRSLGTRTSPNFQSLPVLPDLRARS